MEAADHAVKNITNGEADEYFVIVLSDANLDRYGIRPRHLTDALTANEDVNAYVIFIGSLGDQATRCADEILKIFSISYLCNLAVINGTVQLLNATVSSFSDFNLQ